MGPFPRLKPGVTFRFGVSPLTPNSLYTSLGVGGGERVTNFGVIFLMELAI